MGSDPVHQKQRRHHRPQPTHPPVQNNSTHLQTSAAPCPCLHVTSDRSHSCRTRTGPMPSSIRTTTRCGISATNALPAAGGAAAAPSGSLPWLPIVTAPPPDAAPPPLPRLGPLPGPGNAAAPPSAGNADWGTATRLHVATSRSCVAMRAVASKRAAAAALAGMSGSSSLSASLSLAAAGAAAA